MAATAVDVYHLTLEPNGEPAKEKTYLRLPPPVKPYILRIELEPGSAASKAGLIKTNFPLGDAPFERASFRKIDLPQDFNKPFQVDFAITTAGAFEYYIEYDDNKGQRVRCQSGYFAVDPLLSIPARTSILDDALEVLPAGKGAVVTDKSVNLPLDGLVIQSVIAKWMGPLAEWGPNLDLMSERGYNMIHFTPLQPRGGSGSPYSIFDQLKFDPFLFDKDDKDQVSTLKGWLAKIKKEWGILSLIDVVLNHTASDSAWLEDHPEAGYNVTNSPHLEGALELDTALIDFSSSLEKLGLPTELKSAADLDAVMAHVTDKLLPRLKLYEYYVIDVAGETAAFSQAWSTATFRSLPTRSSRGPVSHELRAAKLADAVLPAKWEQLSSRFGPKVDQAKAVEFIATEFNLIPGAQTEAEATKLLKHLLEVCNVDQYKLFDDDLKAIIDNTRNRVRYTRLDEDGPKKGKITADSPLVESLFTRLPANDRTKAHDPRSLALANNGWIWDADPLKNFAEPDSRTYIRRDLIVWGDCVKLRYGRGPEDSPWLWKHMTAYVELLAGMFEGFRLDNCHSTPLHVGEMLLDAARRVNTHLYVCAELFTGSAELDLHFVCRLGINSLIREAMNSNSAKEESGLLYEYGLGKPIGAMDVDCLAETSSVTLNGEAVPCKLIPLPGSVPHAFLMDCTHDNESPLSKRTAEDALPTGALVTFARAAVGSNRGFDDLYPRLLDVVSENRRYEVYKDSSASGIGAIKRLLNHLHTELVLDDGVEGHFSQEGDVITSHRVNPVTHKGFFLVARTAFPGPDKNAPVTMAPVRLDGTQMKFITGVSVEIKSTKPRDTADTLRGLEAELVPVESIRIELKKDENGLAYSTVSLPDKFPPGSVLVFATSMDGLHAELDQFCATSVEEAVAELDSVELNSFLYRADGEERDAVGGDGVYAVPGMEPNVYCGLQGWMPALRHIMAHNDLGHPLCAHLRSGTWAMDYVVSRLEKQLDVFPRLAKPAQWLKARFEAVKKYVPPFLRPKYFAMIVNVAFKAARDRAIALCSPLIQDGSQFAHALALTSLQMYGQVRSASLDPNKTVPSMAAGLPHFTAGWARTWGRDTAIALRGLFLVTGQYDAAKAHILAFCAVVKHGLVPNLLDSGKTPRYNSRDSPWFMLQNIQDYIAMVPNGESILGEKVKRRFPLDDEWVPFDDPKAYQTVSTVGEIVQEILQRHASGIHFREYNAGPNLDMQMTDLGFNIDIDVDWKTGFIHGGNEHNCGTWMDKMGESAKAGNKGCPGTPRDGAPVEIIGLLKSTVHWLAQLSAEGKFPHKGVEASVEGEKKVVSYAEWDELLQRSFEKHFYIPGAAANDAKYVIKPELVTRRGIYKDVYGTPVGRDKADYQLRANFVIAMAVAPELFTPQHALGALEQYKLHLVGPLGVRTLDPIDSDYRGDYDNSNDSHDRHVAKGWNYHQGPEWVWPFGYFLRAFLIFDSKCGEGAKDQQHTFHAIHSMLATHREHLKHDPWAGLPELTNTNGAYCHDSCRTQAWSTSTILDCLDDIARMSK